MKKVNIALIVLFTLLASIIVVGVDLVPRGDIDGKNSNDIKNFTNIYGVSWVNSTGFNGTYYGDGSNLGVHAVNLNVVRVGDI